MTLSAILAGAVVGALVLFLGLCFLAIGALFNRMKAAEERVTATEQSIAQYAKVFAAYEETRARLADRASALMRKLEELDKLAAVPPFRGRPPGSPGGPSLN